MNAPHEPQQAFVAAPAMLRTALLLHGLWTATVGSLQACEMQCCPAQLAAHPAWPTTDQVLQLNQLPCPFVTHSPACDAEIWIWSIVVTLAQN